jgi:hypothetical protein
VSVLFGEWPPPFQCRGDLQPAGTAFLLQFCFSSAKRQCSTTAFHVHVPTTLQPFSAVQRVEAHTTFCTTLENHSIRGLAHGSTARACQLTLPRLMPY